MNGRLRKFGLAGILVGGTLLFGVGFAGAQSPSGDGSPPKASHSGDAPVIVGDVTAGHGGCGGDGGATAAAVSSIDL
jgi:hypothetical protein